jgi:serine/threonine-protein kinase
VEYSGEVLGALAEEQVGKVVAGRYRIVRLIGRGGMGAIYEVQHLQLGRRLAMKVLSPNLAVDGEALTRFRREAEMISKLRHPHIVELFDWETLEGGLPCMVMELLEGADLATRMRHTPKLGWPLIARIADQVLSALAEVHRAGIVHRDLKPENIFLTGAGDDVRVKLLDFGVSKVLEGSNLTATDQVIGTPAYMSPEQARGQAGDVGVQTDVWAMGAILYEMAAGRQAFSGVNIPAVLFRVCHGDVDPVTAHRADAPPAFAEVIARALAREPAERYASVEELAAGVRAALAPGASAAPAPARRPWWLAIAGAVVVAGVAAFLLWPRHHAAAPLSAPSAPAAPKLALSSAPAAPKPLSIQLVLTPPGATAVFDGQPVQGGTVSVPPDGRQHAVQISAAGYRDEVRMVDSSSPVRLEIVLAALPASRPPPDAGTPDAEPAPKRGSGKTGHKTGHVSPPSDHPVDKGPDTPKGPSDRPLGPGEIFR